MEKRVVVCKNHQTLLQENKSISFQSSRPLITAQITYLQSTPTKWQIMTKCPARIKAVLFFCLSNDCTAQMVNTRQLYAVLFYQSEELLFLSVNAHLTTRLTCDNRQPESNKLQHLY